MSEADQADRLHRWVKKVPPDAKQCGLFGYKMEDAEPLDSWPVTTSAAELCNELLGAMMDDVEDKGGTQTYTVAWIDEKGAILKTKHYKFESEREPGELPDSPNAPNAEGLVRQATRHSEAMAKLYVTNMGHALKAMREVMNAQQEQLQLSYKQNAQLLARLEAVETGEDPHLLAAEAEEASKRAETWERLGNIATDIIQKHGPEVVQNMVNGKAKVTDAS